nr:ABC transporter ATP-binding protein [Yeguia hominis]
MHLLRPYWHILSLSILFAICSVALTLYAPLLIGNGVDALIGPGQVDFRALLPILGKLALVTVGTAFSQWLMNLCHNHVTFRVVQDLRTRAFETVSELPLRYLDTKQYGETISRITTDVDQFSDGLLMGFSQLFTGVITIAGTLGFMISINLPISLVVALITPLSLFVAAFIAKHTYDQFYKQSQARGEMTALVEELVGNAQVVKAFGYESHAQTQFDAINERLEICGRKAVFFSSLTNPCTRFVNGLVYTGVGIVGALFAISGGISVGQLSCFLTYANQYTKPFNEISGVITELQNALASAERVFHLIEEPRQTPDAPDAPVLSSPDGTVDLRHVYFSYRPEVPLIEDFNLSVASGQRIAIVGPTGCGKTTMINLLMRFYDVTAGKILVSGYPVDSITRDSLRGSYGMVLQETWLSSGTVRENIAYGKPDASEAEIIAAAKAAYADGFIRKLPQGYDTPLSEDGGTLSQGQKQLLCIARVMLSLPPMLILDEATSSIDTRTELKIQQAFQRMMEGRTSFLVAHRLSTIQNADSILVMRDGHIVEQGNHAALLAQNGFYAKLYNSQFSK